MTPFDYKNVPPCTIEFPLEITPAEIVSLTSQINTLLKSSFLFGLLGHSQDIEGTFQSIFDLAEEIVGVDCSAYITVDTDGNGLEVAAARRIPRAEGGESLLYAPAVISRIFSKAIYIDMKKEPYFLPVCDFWQVQTLVAFPMRRDLEITGVLVFGKRKSEAFTPVQVKLLWVLAMQVENYLLQSEAVKSLSYYSFLDPLTHLYNRRYFENQLEKEILRSRRSGNPFSLLMIDLDGFKNYNDRFLHSAGDIALQEFASILSDSIREVDTASRLGGDEFSILLVESGAEGARDLAKRVIDRSRNHLLPGIDNHRTERLSACVGIAAFPADSFDKKDLVLKADRALSMAKNQGSGKVCLIHEVADLLQTKPSTNDLPVHKIYNAARSIVDTDKFLEILLFTAMQGLYADRGSIVVTIPDGDLILRAAIGFYNGEERFSPGTTVPPGAVTSWVLAHREALIVSGLQDSPFQQPLKKNGYKTDSFLSVPLIHGDRVLGAIHLTNRKNRQPFTREDLTAFRPIAGEIASILSQGMSFRENIKSFSTSILHSLSNTLELRFPFFSGHGSRVSRMAIRAGGKLGLRGSDLESLRTASALHDIGIVGIPGSILSKKQRLNEREMEIARKHPFLGSKLMEEVPGMEEARHIILEHHETYNGIGYPRGLKGDEISMGGRVLAVAEFYDSITSERPHRGKLRPEEALQLVKNGAGTLFDPEVARLFVEDPAITSPGNFSSPD
jgi:diguanylate cyclase (GGDEF)-like protein